MQQRVPSHHERRSRGGARALAIALLAFVLPSASFGQTPTVDSLEVVPSFFTAKVSANVALDGGSPITNRGVVFAETADNPLPAIGGSGVTGLSVTGPGALGTFNRGIGGLRPNREYSIRAYAINENGAGYSEVKEFTTPCPVRLFPPNIPRGALGTSYSTYLQALGSLGWSETYSLFGALPDGMFLDSWSGQVYGTPTEAGLFRLTVGLVDNFGCESFFSTGYDLVIDALHVVPGKVAFASELVGGTSTFPKVVTIINNGPDVTLSPLPTTSGPFSVVSTTCAATLSSMQSCTVGLTFTPTSAAIHTGTLSIGHAPGAGSPIRVDLSGAGTAAHLQQVYSSNESSDSVTVIDPVTNAVRTVVGVGRGPGRPAVLPGGAKVYVPNKYDHSLSVITTAPTHSVSSTIVNGFAYPNAAVATPTGDAVWVVNRDNSSVTVIETTTDTVVASLSDPCLNGPQGIVANPVNHEMYVLSSNQGSICVFDRFSRAFLRSISVGGFPESAVVLPNGTALYVITGNGGTAVRVALPSGAASSILGVYGHQMDMTADGSRIYVGREGDGLAMINTADNSVSTISITDNPGIFGVAVHDAAGRLFVSDDSGPDRIFVLDLATNTELPNPDLPIEHSSLLGARVLVTAKSGAPGGAAPTVTGLSNGPPAAGVRAVGANVALGVGEPPIFERGFAYSTDPDPEPNKPNVMILPVPGGEGSMNAVLTGLTAGVTYYYQAYAKNIWGTGLSGGGSFLNDSPCPAIGIAEGAVPSGFQGVAYNASFTTTGTATGPYTFEYTNLPPGLSGVGNFITGVPSAGTSVEIFVKVTDTLSGCSAENNYNLLIGSLVAPGDLVISEFRARGVGGAYDDYVEIANRTNGDIVVRDPEGTAGFSIGRSGSVLATIPNSTVIKKGGHWLAVGADFSLWDYGAPNPLCRGWDGPCYEGADADLSDDIPDDMGIGLFKTANFLSYSSGPTGTLLDAVGGSAETDGVFYEGAKLAELGSGAPPYQTAWVRRINNMGVLVDVNDNDRDFTFVATDGGFYGPTAAVAAVLGGPNPEDSYTVRDVLNAELPVSLIEPARGPQRSPNREVNWQSSIEYRRVFTNNTGEDIGTLAFKVINLTTTNTRQTLAVQGDVRVGRANDRNVWVESLGTWIPTTGAQLDYPNMYQHWGNNGWPVGGLNSRLFVSLGAGIPQDALLSSQTFGECGVFSPGESLPVNFYLHVQTGGRYLFVLVPQISPGGGALVLPEIQALKAPSLCGGKGGGRAR